MFEVQTVVVGAGIVGLAIARQLALSGREVVVVERAAQVGTGTSSRNSEVIHSGIYYPPGSLKAALCVAGRDALHAYCAGRGIPHRRTGKLIVATSAAEVPTLERYFELARLNGVGEIGWRTAAEVAALEPEVRCVSALQVAMTGIVDSHALMMSFWGDLQAAGGEVAFLTEVTGVERLPDGRFELQLAGGGESFRCRELVNSAGLDAPGLAGRMTGCGTGSAPQSYFARGHYFALAGQSPFSRLVYPVADAAGLGIHVTIDLAGKTRFGPDVEWTDQPDYRFDPSRRGRFSEAIRRYYPALDEERLLPDYVGVRPKIAPAGAASPDFRIDDGRQYGAPGLVQLYGIESPGLTAALAIGQYVLRRLDS